MSWNSLTGLEREKKILQKAILENRVAGSYCFLGSDGIGKDGLALEFAKTVNCYEPIIYEDSIEACDNCKSCKMASQLSHPGIQYIFSLPTEKMTDEQFSAMKEQINLKAHDIYHKINIPKADKINIALVREVKKNLAFSSAKNGRRFIIVSNADQMNIEAANAFLKTLEEPQSNTTIIITSSKREKLLPTILSRCQQIFCNVLPNDGIAKYLMAKHAKSESEANLIAAISQGSVTKAMEYLDDDIKNLRTFVVDTLRVSLKKINYRADLLDSIDKILERKDRKLNITFLNLLLFWMRDVYSIIMLKNTENVVNIDFVDRMVNFANGFPQAKYQEAFANIENSISKLNQNVAPKLVYLSLFIELRRIFINLNY